MLASSKRQKNNWDGNKGDAMPRNKKVFIIFAFLILWNAGASHAQELKRIRIGYPSLSFRQSNVWVAKEAGRFKKYGLDVEPIFLRGGQIATQALAGGDPPIVNIGTVVQANRSEERRVGKECRSRW